jgi:hypothetical protein
MRQFIQNPRFGQREWGLQQPLLQDADPPGVEAAEMPYRCHQRGEVLRTHIDRINEIIDFVN